MKPRHLEEKRTVLIERRERLIGKFSEATRQRKNAARVCSEIRRTNEFLETLDKIDAEIATESGPRRYAVSSLFLHDCFKKLTVDINEQFFFVTGAEAGGVRVLDQMAELTHHRRTPMGVVAHMPSTHNLLIKLEQFGHKFLAHFHSHPGEGPGSTAPSGTDLDFQRRLEQGGHLAIMGIFSRDGFIRFLRVDQNFELEIYGQGVELYAPGIYRLTQLS